MFASVVSELPAFDTGQYEDYVLEMSSGVATLTIHVAELRPLSFQFSKVRWSQFTALYNCTPEMISDAYFRLVEYKDSPTLKSFINRDSAGTKSYTTLSHYRIFLDETGCHEFFAESVAAL